MTENTNPFAPYLYDVPGTDDYNSLYLLFPDDEKWLATLLRNNWSLTGPSEYDKAVNLRIYYDSTQHTTRDNHIGSILIYDASNMQHGEAKGIAYESISPSRTLTIDIQVPKVRDRVMAWTREVIRILYAYRMSGRMILDGWDKLSINSVGRRNNYVGFYQVTIDVKLQRAIVDLPPKYVPTSNTPSNDETEEENPNTEEDIQESTESTIGDTE